MRTFTFILVASVLACAPLSARDTIRLELPDAIRIGVSNSVQSIVARNEFLSSYWDYRTYRAELLPEISLSGTLPYYSKTYNTRQGDDGTYTYVPNNYNTLSATMSMTQNIPLTGGALSVKSSLDRLRQNGASGYTDYKAVPYQISLSQPIVGFNSLRWQRRIEPVKYEEARKRYVSEQENIALSVIAYYFSLLSAEINLDIARQNRNNSERLYAISEAKRERGQLSEVELQQMRTSLVKAEITLTDRAAALEARMFELRSLLGFGEDVVIRPVIPELWEDIPYIPLNEVTSRAEENHYFTEESRRRMLEAERNVRQARANRWSISLNVSYGMSGRDYTFHDAYSSGNWRDDQMINVTLRVPILDWGKGRGKVQMAEANREATEARVRKDRTDYNQELYLLVQDFNHQPRQLFLARELDEVARSRYATTVEAFVQGKMDILNLNNAEEAKDEARRNYIDSLYQLWYYYYRIRSLTLYDFLRGHTIEPQLPL